METMFFSSSCAFFNAGSYRTYEEWKPLITFAFAFLTLRSYRTYEEWKLQSLDVSHWRWSWVLTVPMRNGNVGNPLTSVILHVFLPYLWGMETIFTSARCTCSHTVLTVPMRNGNYSDWKLEAAKNALGSYRTYEEWKHWQRLECEGCTRLFLPYLWGMETHGFRTSSKWQ